MKVFGMGTAEMLIILILVVVPLLLAIIPAKIASNKGYSFVGFYIFGFFFWLIALIVALVISDKNQVSTQDLMNLKKLLDDGAITQEEFDREKAKLL